VIADMRKGCAAWSKVGVLTGGAEVFSEAIDALEGAVRYVVANYGKDLRSVSVGAVPLLKLFGVVAGGWQLLRSSAIAQARLAAPADGQLPEAFYRAKIETARFYADYLLPQAPALAHAIVKGAAGALAEGVL
jgi:3-(methylthio)propanoyl-CoA dehydrogenase